MKFFLPFSLLILLCGSAVAQQEPADEPVNAGEPATTISVDVNELGTITVDVDVVNILCSVRDKNGGLVSTLNKEDFVLEEDQAEQEIKYFARETDLPLTIGLLVDVSKSQEALIETERHAAHRFFSEVLRKKDLAFVISFGVDAELLQDLTNSAELLRDGLADMQLNAAVGGMTPGTIPQSNQRGTIMYDSVFLAAEDMLRKEAGRKVIVLVSDGVDVGSRISKSRAIEVAQMSDVIIYSIYYADPRYQAYANGYGDLKKMSSETGGRVFRVSRKNSLERIFAEIEEEMRSQYSIGFSSTNPEKDGSFRKIRIKTKQKGLKVQARRGYYATRQR